MTGGGIKGMSTDYFNQTFCARFAVLLATNNADIGRPGITRGTSHLNVISRVRYRQDAAVSAQLVVQWIDPKDKRRHKENFGHCKPIATQDEFTLVDAGIPDGAMVKFSSYVSAIGEYENDRWFKVKKSVSEGASFRQTGTAFKGWFEYVGLYDFHTAIDDLAHGPSKADSIARVQYMQDAAVSAYLSVQWIDPKDESSHRKDLGSWKPIGTQAEFDLVAEGIPEGALVQFSSYVAAIGEYPNDLWFVVDSSASKRVTFRQTGTAFKGWFAYQDMSHIS